MLGREEAGDGTVGPHAHEGEAGIGEVGKQGLEESQVHRVAQGDGGLGDIGLQRLGAGEALDGGHVVEAVEIMAREHDLDPFAFGGGQRVFVVLSVGEFDIEGACKGKEGREEFLSRGEGEVIQPSLGGVTGGDEKGKALVMAFRKVQRTGAGPKGIEAHFDDVGLLVREVFFEGAFICNGTHGERLGGKS